METSTRVHVDHERLDLHRADGSAPPRAGWSESRLRPTLFAGTSRGWRVSGFDPLIGRTLDGGYHVSALLARSRTTRIYGGYDTATMNPCVLKFARNPEDPAARLRLLREAYLTQQVSHLNIVRLLFHGELLGFGPYLAMEYLAGPSLAALIAKGPLPVTPALFIAIQIASALHSIHQRGMEHRDVKPANILLDRGAHLLQPAKLIDFASADYSSEDERETQLPSGAALEYVAPERREGGLSGPLSDQYSFGCVLYAMLTGQAPYAGESAHSLLEAQLKGGLTPPSKLRTDGEIPLALDYAVLRALAVAPQARFESMAVLCTALVACLGSSSLSRYLTLRVG